MKKVFLTAALFATLLASTSYSNNSLKVSSKETSITKEVKTTYVTAFSVNNIPSSPGTTAYFNTYSCAQNFIDQFGGTHAGKVSVPSTQVLTCL